MIGQIESDLHDRNVVVVATVKSGSSGGKKSCIIKDVF